MREDRCATRKIGPGPVKIKANYPEGVRQCQESFSCFLHTRLSSMNTYDLPDAEREAFLEQQYRTRGFGLWVGNFRDMLTSREANAVTLQVRRHREVRQRVKEPQDRRDAGAHKDHGFGPRRVPMESGYYEVYNQPNVELVSIVETPRSRRSRPRASGPRRESTNST